MRRMWRRLVRKWREFREAGHKALVLHRHLEGRCTWIEEPSHGSFRWRKCEYAFCDKREYMADTSARWAPVPPSPVAQRLTAAAARLRGQGVVGVSPIEERVREINDFYQRQLVNHLDGHRIIGYTLDDAINATFRDVVEDRPILDTEAA